MILRMMFFSDDIRFLCGEMINSCRTSMFWPGQVNFFNKLVPGQIDFCSISTALVKVISLPYIFQVLYVLRLNTRPRYQVSVNRRTIGPLVRICPNNFNKVKIKYTDK